VRQLRRWGDLSPGQRTSVPSTRLARSCARRVELHRSSRGPGHRGMHCCSFPLQSGPSRTAAATIYVPTRLMRRLTQSTLGAARVLLYRSTERRWTAMVWDYSAYRERSSTGSLRDGADLRERRRSRQRGGYRRPNSSRVLSLRKNRQTWVSAGSPKLLGDPSKHDELHGKPSYRLPQLRPSPVLIHPHPHQSAAQ